jgi:hypothetical protein
MSQRLHQGTGLPLLVACHPQDPVPEVVVHADHVGEHVVAVVVGISPLRGHTDHVPLPGSGMDFRIVHPMAVADIVGDLHTLDTLRRRECDGPEDPPGLAEAATDDQPRSDIETTLKSIVRQMYAPSLAPRESSTSSRIVSSSTASTSTSAALRWGVPDSIGVWAQGIDA